MLAASGLLLGCSNDDSNNTVNPAGIYKMTAFNSSVPTDLNEDGTASTNQMSESTCFTDNTFVINSDNTFTATQKGVEIGFDGTNETIECYTDPSISGTWDLNGTVITFSYTEDGVPTVQDYVVSNTTLIMTMDDGEVVGTSGGNPVYLTSNLEVIYTKQ